MTPPDGITDLDRSRRNEKRDYEDEDDAESRATVPTLPVRLP